VEHNEVHILSDDPADEDSFGSHARVAKAVSDLITSEPQGHTIGLEGTYGSGKSTIVHQVVKFLGENQSVSTHVAIFDAWGHQGDPLRRSFLESLVSDLETKGWIDGKKWITRSAELAGRMSNTKVTTTPRLTFAGRILSLATLLTPIGLVLLNHDLSKGEAGSQRTLSWILSLSVLISALLLFFIRFILSNENQKAEFDPLTPLTSSHVREEVTTSVEHGEPTTIEFESFFNDLMGEALSEQDRRLVIVLDNIDRASGQDALAILGTLQSFRPARVASWVGNLWTIVPYDFSALSALWGYDRDAARTFSFTSQDSFLRIGENFLRLS
jgi:hypothetical protein